MNIAEIFIRRPIMTTLVMMGILLFGVMGYLHLPVSDLPNVDFPTILVMANQPGANPETMASAVATPLEKEFSTIACLDTMSSANALGFTQITLQFSLDRNIDAAAQDVQSAIARAARLLPQNLPTPPYFRKVNPADQPVLYLSLNSLLLPLYVIDEYGQTIMAQRISMVSGVAQVLIFGSQKYAVRVQLNPQALASRAIGIDEVSSAVQASNVNLPTGTFYGNHQAFSVQANGQLTNAAPYRPLIAAYRNGSPVRLRKSAGPSTAWRMIKSPVGIKTEGPLFWPFNVNRGPTPSRWSIPSKNYCPPFAPNYQPRLTSISSMIVPNRSGIRWTMSNLP